MIGSTVFSMNSGNILPNSWNRVPGVYGQMGQDSRNAQAAQINQVMAGYGNVLNTQRADLNKAFGYLRGTNRAAMNDINKDFTKYSGQAAQDLIGRGLGNSTIQSSVQTGIKGAWAGARAAARAAFGQRMYDAYSRNALANSGLATQALSFLGNVDIGYPDPSMASMSGYGGFPVAPGGGGGGSLVVGDPNRPVGGFQPGWAHYGGPSGIDAVGGGGPMQAYGIPTTGQYAQGQMQDQGQGFWGQLADTAYGAANANNAVAAAQDASSNLMSLYADSMF